MKELADKMRALLKHYSNGMPTAVEEQMAAALRAEVDAAEASFEADLSPTATLSEALAAIQRIQAGGMALRRIAKNLGIEA